MSPEFRDGRVRREFDSSKGLTDIYGVDLGGLNRAEVHIPDSGDKVDRYEDKGQLSDLYISHEKLIESGDNYVVTNNVEGEEVMSHLSESGSEEAMEVGSMIGHLLADLHVNGISHGDPHLRNIIYDEGDLHLIDFEHFQKNADIQDKVADLQRLGYNARVLDNYQEFFTGLEDGYREELESARDSWRSVETEDALDRFNWKHELIQDAVSVGAHTFGRTGNLSSYVRNTVEELSGF